VNELLRVENLSVRYARGGPMFGRRASRLVVRDVSFAIAAGQTFGLVGESGSGKTTTGRAILRLVEPAAGRITFDGEDVTGFGRRTPLWYRQAVQVVFQNPTSALNPSLTVRELLAEPLRLHQGQLGEAGRRAAVDTLLDQVGLATHHQERYPWELSGGQRQRVAIARALAVRPKLVLCDEPVSALDVSTQSQVINLLQDLQAELGVSYLFVAHDLSVVRHISQQVGVMYDGRLLEVGPAARVYDAPAHPYTQTLLAAIPVPDPVRQRAHRALRRRLREARPAGAPSSGVGCPFQDRCPYVMDVCREAMPEPSPVRGGGTVACHLQTTGPRLAGQSLPGADAVPVGGSS
jgi:oligopeptide/dipeptide ABC transporter ATP-binding protein